MCIAKTDHIIFCLSYLEVPNTVTLIEKYNKDTSLVVTSNENIYKLFSLIYGHRKALLLEKQVPFLSRNPIKIIGGIKDVIKIKNRAWNQLKIYNHAEVYFSAIAYSEFEAYLALKLSQNNILYYKSIVSLDHLNTRYSFYSLTYIIICRILYGLKLKPLWNISNYFFSIENQFSKFLAHNKFIINSNLADKAVQRKLNIANKEFLFLSGGIVEEGRVHKDEYINKVDQLINLLDDKCGINAGSLKVHPNYNKTFSLEKKLEKIPKYYPANMIFSYYKFIISYNSGVLFEIANQGGIAISLLKYMSPTDIIKCQNDINYLKQNSINEIFFPDSIRDIKMIINNLSKV